MVKYFTPGGLEKLKKELDYLKNIERKEIAQRLKRCSSFGDLTENAEYLDAKDAQGFLEGKISELENLLRNGTVVTDKKNIGLVQIGSTVLISHSNNPGEKQEFKIVGTKEGSPLENKISIDSPLGKAILNKSQGMVVEVDTPEGTVQYKILKIE